MEKIDQSEKEKKLILETEFLKACASGDVETVQKLLSKKKNKIDVHIQDSSAIRISAENGHIEIVKLLTENGAYITENYSAPVRYAAKENHLDILKYLHQKGATLYDKGNQALNWAIEKGHNKVCKYLLDNTKQLIGEEKRILNLIVGYKNTELMIYMIEARKIDYRLNEDKILRWSIDNKVISHIEYLYQQKPYQSIVKKMIKKSKNQEVQQWLNGKELSKKLEKILPNNNEGKKKSMKI